MFSTLATLTYPHFSPILFRLGPLAVRWYGLAYVAAFVISYLLLRHMARRSWLRIPPELVGDLVTWLAVGVVVGGRAGWWIFYHRNMGQPEPWYEPLATWHGGMSFHGGLAGVAIAAMIWTRRHRVSLLNLADCAALVTPIGLCFGRLANFVNGELVGRPTTLPWGMIFPGDTVPRHPSQLYEAFLEGPLLLLVLWFIWRTWKLADGALAGLFMVFYGLFRFAVEFTREPDVQLGFIAWGWLTMGQILSLALVVVGLLWWWAAQRRARRLPRLESAAIRPVPAAGDLPARTESGHKGERQRLHSPRGPQTPPAYPDRPSDTPRRKT